MESAETVYTDYYRIKGGILEVTRVGRASTVDLWLCENYTKTYLKTVDLDQVMVEVAAMRME